MQTRSPVEAGSFFRSLWAGVQPTLDPRAETFMNRSNAPSRRGLFW